MKLIKISILTTAATANMERRFSFLTFLSTEPRITLASNPLEKLMQLMDPYIYDLDREEITNKEKFQKKLHSVVPNLCNLTIHIYRF